VADDIERALASVNKDQLKSLPAEYQSFKTFYEGVELTNKSFSKVFQQFKISPYCEINDKFDPDLHDALFQIPNPSKENGTIVQILKKGYKLSDRVIRAAQVGTVNNP
jgi:molecular chaperone GrpE